MSRGQRKTSPPPASSSQRSRTVSLHSRSTRSEDAILRQNELNAGGGDIVRVLTTDGPMWVFSNDVFVSRSLAVYGEYCAAESEVFRQLVRPGQAVVEIGANIGSHSVQLARLCAPGSFLAFEPQQRVFQVLCTNLTINGVTNARTYPEAVGSSEGHIRIAMSDYSAPGNFGAATVDGSEGPQMDDVRMRTLDSMALSRCDFIKIDVKGWERQVLEGAVETIGRCRPILYVENDRASQQGELISFINGLGYRQFWHVAPLFRPNNFRGVQENVLGDIVSLNMLCIPLESGISVTGFEEIDPANWKSPVRMST